MKLIVKLRNSKVKPFAIIFFDMSRTGGGAVSLAKEIVEDLGIHIISAESRENTFTVSGRLNIYHEIIKAAEENEKKLKNTLPGMRDKLGEDKEWLGAVPRGYTLYGPKVVDSERLSKDQRIELNEEGEILIKAWVWKLDGLKDYEIIIKLDKLGVKITKQGISNMWRNVFYAGIISNALLKGEIRKGKWKRMVSHRNFLKVQDILDNQKRKGGYKQDKQNENLTLASGFATWECSHPLVGYHNKKKDLYYYKCNSCNKSANAFTTKRSLNAGVNNSFSDYLNSWQYHQS